MDLIIKYIAIVYVETGVVKNIYTVPPGIIPTPGLIEGSDPAEELVHIPSEGWEDYEKLEIIEQFYRPNGEWVHRGRKPTRYHEWNTSTNEWQHNWDSFLNHLRKERNRRLGFSDWTQVVDNPMEESVRASWRNYRNLLRNFPASFQTPDPTISSLENLDWPEPPDGSTLEVTLW